MRVLKILPLLAALLLPLPLCAGEITIAAASDLRFALDEVVAVFSREHPADNIEVVYGSSGTFNAQIREGAPYDLYFSADISYPQALEQAGFAASTVQPYAIGRIVLWSATHDASALTLADLARDEFARIAIANPEHAPYGQRAEEALRALGLWESLEPKLVYGDNIAQTAQFVQSGNAQVGIIALALALNPALAMLGPYLLIPDTLHAPLEQGFIVTKRAESNALAMEFAAWIRNDAAKAIMTRHGFVLPE